MADAKRISILFVCLGNICRSTMAEGVFRSLTAEPPYNRYISVVDSCGTGAYHTGDEPDPRTMRTLNKHGITDYEHAARKIRSKDFEEFDYIMAMDGQNLSDLRRLQQRRSNSKAKVMLFGEYSGHDGKAEEVEDPYYGAQNGFELAYQQCVRFSNNFLEAALNDPEPQNCA